MTSQGRRTKLIWRGRGMNLQGELIRIIVTVFVLLTVPVISVVAESHPPGNVLLLNSYHPGFSWSDEEEAGVIKELGGALPSVNILIEYLDTKHYPEASHLVRMKNFLIDKYHGKKINLIIALDDAAVEMLTTYREELFPDIPVVFAGITSFDKYAAKGLRGITGVLETQDVKDTIDVALRLHPNTREILAISDMTVSGISAQRALKAIQPVYDARVKIRIFSAYTFEEARATVAALPTNAIVLLNSYATDSEGKTLSTKDSTRMIVSAAKVPVYGVHENRFGDGIVGGYLLSGREQGRRAARIVLRILAGEDLDAIPIKDAGTAIPMFDYKQMERFDIPLSKLPEGSVIINEPVSVFTTHGKFAITIIAVLIILAVVTSLLAFFIVRLLQARAELRKKTEELDRIFNLSLDVICIASFDGRLIRLNPAWESTLGYRLDELEGRKFFDLIHPDDVEVSRKTLAALAAGRTVFDFANRNLCKDGTYRWLEWRSKPYQDALVYAVGRDITGRKKAEEEKNELRSQLQQAQKMESVGRLAGGVAHDFNNMLSVILGYSELALEQTDPALQLHGALRKIMKAARHSADITRQLLAFARKQTVSPKVLDINRTVAGMTGMLRRFIGEDIDLVWLPGEAVWPVRMDPGQIDQILVNLCVNARDAIADVGKLTIETGKVEFDEAYCAHHYGFPPGEYVLLAVSDNGCGMDAETLRNVFEPFFTTKDSGKGTGLGLATIYGIVKQNNGFINVYSEPGQGTTFKIYLPRHRTEAECLPEKVMEPPAKSGHETILLVEDELAILEMTTMMLERLDYTVVAARTPSEAIHLAREYEGEIHLLATDVVMPGMNGWDLAESILSIHSNLRCLFMSGYTANIIAHHGVLEEDVNFIQKPFSKEQLGAKVREALDKKR